MSVVWRRTADLTTLFVRVHRIARRELELRAQSAHAPDWASLF